MTDQETRQLFRSHFLELERSLNGGASSDLHRKRQAAIAHFEELLFPQPGDEEWRFTNVAPIARTRFRRAPRTAVSREAIEPFTFHGVAAMTLVFVDGQFAQNLSTTGMLPEGAVAESLAVSLQKQPEMVLEQLARFVGPADNGFTALNAAFMGDGAFITVPDHTELDQPIHILYVATGQGEPAFMTPRNLVVTGRNCRLAIVESYVALSGGTYLTNVVSEVILGEHSVLEHDKLQLESVNAYHVGTTHIQHAAHSTVTSNAITLGGSIVRNTITAVLNGEGIESTLNGLSLGTGRQLVDNHTVIDHAKPHCASHELYKAILDGASRGVFNGKIFVRKDAQKTDAKQTNKTLLLSDEATIDTKPQLEIFADDVRCTHGATVGQLDEEQLFYLRSRGVDEASARDILTYAFAHDVIGRVHVDPLREQLDGMLRTRLREGRVREVL